MGGAGVIGRVVDVRSTTIRVALDVGAKGFTKVGPDGLQTVGVVNSYITVPAGAHRVVVKRPGSDGDSRYLIPTS